MNGNRNKNFARFSILLAIEAIVCFTPLGSLPAFGPIVATLGMIPVIITAQTMGVAAGSLMGFFAGLFSCIVWTFMPPNPVLAFVFTPFMEFAGVAGGLKSVFICFVPRILVGTVAGLVLKGMRNVNLHDTFGYALSGFLGSAVNTALVMGGIYVLFGQSYAEALGIGYELLLGLIGTTVLTSGIPEAILGAIAGMFVSRPINKYIR